MNPTIQLLHDARHEINALRRRNEILSAKVEVMELFAVVLHTTPAVRDQGMSIDITYQLEQESNRLQDIEQAKSAVTAAQPPRVFPQEANQF